MRTYLDETALSFGDAAPEVISNAIEDLCKVADAVRSHDDEVLLRSADIYDFEVRPNLKLLEFLYSSNDNDLVDARRRLQVAIDRTTMWDNSDYELATTGYDVQIDGSKILAPSLSQAVAAHIVSGPVAVLALRTAREPGAIAARSAEADVITPVATLLVLTSASDRPAFVRAWMLAHPPTPATVHAYCDRAFPDLRWTETARSGLRSHGRTFFDDRFDTTMRHLSVLNDHGAEIFSRVHEAAAREKELGSHGVDASAESTNTRANGDAKRQRAGSWKGEVVHFWWHTKIRHNSGRIHFHHDPGPAGDAPGKIVLGFLVEHFDT